VLPPAVRGCLVTVLLCVSVFTFIDWAPLIYAYEDPAPLRSPGLHQFSAR
jgi:hypothetical protein